jgi:hypothetical protein
MSNVAREMIRAYFGIVETDSDLRLQKIRELRERDEDAGPARRRAGPRTSSFILRTRPLG